MELIKNKEDLIWYLTTPTGISKRIPTTVNVTSELRKKILTDHLQGYFILKGCRMKFGFKNLGGGVWSAFIDKSC